MSNKGTTTTIHFPPNPPEADGTIYTYEVNANDEPIRLYGTGITFRIEQRDFPSPFERALASAVIGAIRDTVGEYVRVVDGKVVIAMPLSSAEAANE